MNNWITAAETALTSVYNQTQVPYEFEFWNEEKRGKPPDTYLVYFLVSNPTLTSADNAERSSTPRVQVSMFYRNISAMAEIPETIIKAMTDAGFRRFSEGRIPFQRDAGFYGWRCEFIFYEKRS